MVFSFNLKISSKLWELENTISSIDFECKVFSKTPCVIIDNCYKYIYTKNICKLCAEIMKHDY